MRIAPTRADTLEFAKALADLTRCGATYIHGHKDIRRIRHDLSDGLGVSIER